MATTNKKIGLELIFHVLLISIVFIFYAFDRKDSTVEMHEVTFFLNYVAAAYLINFWLLPRFLYKKRYLVFASIVLLLLAAVIAIEEGVIEKIYFPDTRGKGFPGVFDNLLGIMPVITILVGFKFAWDAFQKQRQVDDLKLAVQESELQFLKTQINPHFLFNNLNNLYAYALEKSDKTPEIILELSGVLRYLLYECQEKYVPLSKEIEQLHNFINLSKLQLEDRGTIDVSVNNQAKKELCIAPFLLSVFIENAFKHSGSSQSKNIKIKVDLSIMEDGNLYFYCENTFSKNTNTERLSKGIGLENVKKRLQLIYPGEHTLLIQEIDQFFQVTLNLNLNREE